MTKKEAIKILTTEMGRKTNQNIYVSSASAARMFGENIVKQIFKNGRYVDKIKLNVYILS